jgi:long-chain acyl-CoA synthetase
MCTAGPGFEPNMTPMHVDFFERLAQHAGQRPNDVVLQAVSGDDREVLAWRQLICDVQSLSLRLRQAVPHSTGSHVAVLIEDSPRFGVAFLAAYSAGSVVVPLDPSQELQSLSKTATHAECRVLLFTRKYEAVALAMREANPGLELLSASSAELPSDPASPIPWPLEKRAPEDDLAILYTGGTTGSPKGVRLTEANLMWTIWDMLAVCPVNAQDHILSVLPMFHVMAILANLLGPLYVGARVTYLMDRDPVRLMKVFREDGITAFVCVPQFYYRMLRQIMEQVEAQPALRRFAFHRLLRLSRFLNRRLGVRVGRQLFSPIHERFGPRFRLFGVGAASFSPETAQTLIDLGFNLFQAYGLTETSGPVTVDPPGSSGGTTCGPAMPHARIRIHQPGESGIGEILIAGEHVSPGYWKDQNASAEILRDGWLWSGDLGFVDSSGRLHVTGRSKEVVVLSSGKNVFPEEVEFQIQKSSEFIQEVCVLGCGSGSGAGDRLHAVVVPDFDRLRSKAVINIHDQIRYDMDNACRTLPPYQRVQSFEIRNTPLPRTATRKLKRFEVRACVNNPRNNHAGFASGRPEPEVFSIIRRMKENCGIIGPQTHLELDLGFDSLERVELMSNVRSAFGVDITSEQAGRIFTVGDLAQVVETAAVRHQDWLGWPEILSQPLSEDQRRIASLHLRRKTFLEPGLFAICRLVRAVAGLLLNLTVSGRDKIPLEYPFLICSNHASYLDPLLIAAALPFRVFRRLFFLGAEKYTRTSLTRNLGRIVRSIHIDSGIHAAAALRLAAEGLKKGFILCVFPEGHRSIDGSLLPFHSGPSILAIEAGVPILPVAIVGTQRVWGRASRRFQLNPVQVRFGQPIRPKGANYGHLTEQLREAIGELAGLPVGAAS